MTKINPKMNVAIAVAILLAMLVLGQTPVDSGMTAVSCDVSNFVIVSQACTAHDAISIDGNADFLVQAIAESWDGSGSVESPIVIENYMITDTGIEGIRIWNVNLHWIVRNCVIQGGIPYACGFSIDNCSNGEFSNNIIQDRDVGIQAYEGTYNVSFLNNEILNNQGTAFRSIGGMRNCIISGNTILDNVGTAMWFTGGFNDSVISGNTVRGGNIGIRATACLRSSITGNSVNDTGLDAFVFPSATGILISGNSVYNSTASGILTSGSFAEIYNNIVVNTTGAGIYLASGDNSTVTGNRIVNAFDYGLKLGGATTNTSVTENSFFDNSGGTSQVMDDGENNVICYNHYNDWISPDEDSNGIVDVEYSLDGDSSNTDSYPIVDSAGTIPSPTTPTGRTGFQMDSLIIAGIGIGAIVLIAVIFLIKRR